jgi:hypothetical protein
MLSLKLNMQLRLFNAFNNEIKYIIIIELKFYLLLYIFDNFDIFDNLSPVEKPISSNVLSVEVRSEVLCTCKIYITIIL